MTPQPVEVVTNKLLKILADNIAVNLVVPPGRRQFIETNVQMLMVHYPKITPTGLYYMTEGQYDTLPGKQLHDVLERVAADSINRAMREGV